MDKLEVISTYTRRQALDDGLLIDVTNLAKNAGFKVKTAITANLKADFPGDDEILDLLLSFRLKIDLAGLCDESLVVLKGRKGSDVFLSIAPDDEGAPCLTMMRAEDL